MSERTFTLKQLRYVLDEYDWTKKEQQTIAMFIQTLLELKPGEENEKEEKKP